MSTITLVEHLARVEGHGGITLEMEGDDVSSVRFDVLEGPRLLEQLLHGQPYDQVAPILSRICSICSVAHAVTSLEATEAAFGIVPSPQTRLLRELMFLGENIESHALHVFLLALPDYFGVPSAPVLAKTQPEAVRAGLRLKATGNLLQETIGGRAIHPVNAVLGGVGRAPVEADLRELRYRLGAAAEDARLAVSVVAALPPDDFVSADTTFAAVEMRSRYGYVAVGDRIAVVSAGGRRHVPSAEYRALTSERAVAHSYAKHSMFAGEPLMVGALARLTANRRRVSAAGVDAIARLGLVLPSTNPLDNTRAQVVELVLDVERALAIVEQLLSEGVQAERPVAVQPRAGRGTAVTEAPRGLLVHSYEYDERGRVVDADVITPTAINAASMEQHFRASVAQCSDKSTGELTRRLEMVARAYDPCISCSVHLVRRG